MQFLVHGSIAFDLLFGYEGSFPDAIDPKALDRLSVSFVVPRYQRQHGGTGANISWNLGLLGHAPSLVGAAGHDGDEYLSMLSEKRVDTAYVTRSAELATSIAIVATDNGEHQIAFFHPGADAVGTLPSLTKEQAKKFSFAIVSPRNPVLMLQGAEQCHALGIPYLFDPGQLAHVFSRDEFRRAIASSKGLVVNEYEWQLTQTKTEWNQEDVVEACGLLIVTLGERGIILMTKDGEVTVPAAKPHRVINPTGAGDAARAGLMHGLASKWSLTDTGRLAAILGCLVVEQEGTLLANLAIEDIQSRAKQAYGEELPL